MTNNQNKMLAKLMHSAFGNKPNARVVEYLNDGESLRIPILICPDSPLENFRKCKVKCVKSGKYTER
jgi:hypothetical protein